jgi:hypothetical protein
VRIKQGIHLVDITHWVLGCQVEAKLAETAIRFIAEQAQEQLLVAVEVQAHKLLVEDMALTV